MVSRTFTLPPAVLVAAPAIVGATRAADLPGIPPMDFPDYTQLGRELTLPPPRTCLAPMLRACGRALDGALHANGFRSRLVETPWGRMYGLVAKGRGALPPVVVLPGLGSRVHDYTLLLWHLKHHFSRVVVFELPSHGRSADAPNPGINSFAGAIDSAMAQLVPEPAYVLGHSLGGMAAMLIALRRPQAVLGLALVSPAGGPFDATLRSRYLKPFALQSHADADVIANATWPPRHRKHYFLPAAVYNRLSQPNIQRLVNSDLFLTYLGPQSLQSLPKKTLFMWGTREALLPSHHAHYFRQHLPAESLKLQPRGAAHNTVALGSKTIVEPIVRFFSSPSVPP